jgi:Na+/proline symporter
LAQLNGYGFAVIAFLTFTLIIGLSSYRLVKKSSARYMVAGKSLSLFFVGTMLAAQSIDGNASLGAVSLVYQFGFWAGAAIPIGLATCLLLTGLFYGKRLNQMSLLTLPDFYYRRFGSGPEAITSLIMVLSFIILVAGNFAASALILSTVFDIDFGLAVLIPALIVLAYTYAGGLFSSAYTDIFQTYLAIFAFWAAFAFFALGFTGVQYTTVLHSVPSAYLDLSGLISIKNGALANWASILALGLGDIVALDFMERVFASRDGTTARRSAFMGATLTALTIIPISMLGIMAVYFLPKLPDPFTAYPRLAINFVPFPIGALLLMGVLGASMSSANGGLLAIARCEERFGELGLYEWIKRFKTIDEAEKDLFANFQPAGHNNAILLREAKKHEIILVSDIPDNMVKDAFMTPAHSAQEALEMALDKKGRDTKILTMPYNDCLQEL